METELNQAARLRGREVIEGVGQAAVRGDGFDGFDGFEEGGKRLRADVGRDVAAVQLRLKLRTGNLQHCASIVDADQDQLRELLDLRRRPARPCPVGSGPRDTAYELLSLGGNPCAFVERDLPFPVTGLR